MAFEQEKKLLVITSEKILEKQICEEIQNSGVTGYTIMDVRGNGSHGRREGGWDHSTNIRIEIIGSLETLTEISGKLVDKYFENYAMISYITDVSVMRPDKFL
jgi:nitrogen regulatory protein PII